MSTIPGSNFAETLFGGVDADVIFGWDAANAPGDFGPVGDGDVLVGDAGNDQVRGGGGNDVLYGGADDDRLQGGTGDDTLYGDTGKDVVVAGTVTI